MKQRGLSHAVGMATCALMIVAMMLAGGSHAVAQEAGPTPGSEAGQEGVAGLQPAVTPTPVVGTTSGQVQAPGTPAGTESLPTEAQGPVASGAGGDTGAPVLAQGVVPLTGDAVIWQVREVALTGTETVTGNARVILQRAGASIIRTDATGERIRLEPGEAFFAAAGDAYTTMPDGTEPSTVWILEVSNTNQVGEGAFYLSPDVPGYAAGTYDFEFTRYVVPVGESADFMGGDGPSLLVVLSGSAEVTVGNEVAALGARDGLVVDGAAVIGAPSGDAVVIAMTLGPQVTEDTAAAPAGQPVPAAPADPAAAPADAAAAPADAAAPPADAAAAPAPPAPAPASGEGGAFVTSIKVGAVEGIAVTVYADGQVVFDGWIEAGQWTEFFTGTTFEVFTSSGSNTMFQNTCSAEPFWMDQTPGETSYVLTAGPSSCAPV